ncbi:MAG: serine hydrolase domain-containing protein [Pseudomonadota bacterium]|nr:serine hydrolase domain-containing protein [Pseudomonadota bacterium]
MRRPWQQTASIAGEYTTEFAALAQSFQRLQPQPQRGGAALAVYFQDQCVVDIWSGWQRPEQPWAADTLAMSFSTGKAVLSTLVHRLVELGRLDYDRPLAVDWPEFAQQGKQSITLRHILTHSSGLYDVRGVLQSAATMLKWDEAVAAYAAAVPRFAAGQDYAYQAISYGWLIGGLIERVMGEPLAMVLDRELVQPLGLSGDVYFGVPEAELLRVARAFPLLIKPDQQNHRRQVTPPAQHVATTQRRPLSTTEKLSQMLTGQDPYDFDDALKPKGIGRFNWYGDRQLQACIPAVNGVFTARALAKMYAMLANRGEWQGQRYLSEATFRALSTVQTRQRDRIMPIPMHWRLGYHRVLTLGKQVPAGFGHIGYNGSGAWCDPQRQMSFAYVHSYTGSSIAGDPRLWLLSQRALQAADKILNGRAGWR